MFLGFDVSTSIVGWSLLKNGGQLEKFGYVKMTKKAFEKNLFLKMDYFLSELHDTLLEYKDSIDHWAVEEAVKKFSGGKSSANTIFTCASFNFGVAYSVYSLLEKKPVYIPVTTARKLVGLKIPRGLDKNEKKSKVVEWCTPRHPSIKWEYGRTGKYSPWCYDVADSLVLTEALRLKHGSSSTSTLGSN